MVIITEKKNQNNSIEERQKVDELRGDDLIRKEHGSHTREPKGLFDVSRQQIQYLCGLVKPFRVLYISLNCIEYVCICNVSLAVT